MSNVTKVKSYDEAIGALKKGAVGIKVVCEYEGNEQSFHKFVDSLASNKTCKVLDLYWNHIDDEGARRIADALKINKSLQNLNLLGNSIGTNGTERIADALKVNTSFLELNLRENNIQNAGAGAIRDAIHENQECALMILYLDLNGIDQTLLNDIDATLRRNR
mmetsp:Transcript_14662/g.16721  ORF Transcript_14662/g.16721 Transcript_14662/m.16721 type:complete len:163 (+) Transcript_14662:67-555(+)